MTTALKWLLAIILLAIVGLVIWMIFANPNTSSETEETITSVPEQTVNPVLWVSGKNHTQNLDVANSQAKPLDVLVFTLHAENKRETPVTGFVIETSIKDMVNGATLIEAGGAAYNSQTNVLTWTPQDIPAKQSIQRTFSVRVNSNAPDTVSALRVGYNNDLAIALSRPTVAGTSTDGKGYAAPQSGVPLALNFALGLASVAGFAVYSRLRK